MRKIILSILLLVSLRLAAPGQEVKIVHLGVGHGDSTLIVIKDCTDNTDDTKCMNSMRQVNILIDTSIRGFKKMFRAVKKELDPENKGYHIDFLILSHLDIDHYAGAAGVLDGVRADAMKARNTAARREQMAATLEKEAAETTREDVKQRRLAEANRLREEAKALRASVAWVDKMIIYDRKSLYDDPPTATKWKLPKAETTERESGVPLRNPLQVYLDARKPFERPQEKAKTQTPPLLVGKNILESYQLKHMEMVCIASNGAIGKIERGKLAIDERAQPSPSDSNEVRSENDLSFAFLLRFGSFRYYTGGDLCGVEKEESKTLYTNMESPLAAWVKARWDNKHPGEDFHVCAAKINHHGSNSSTNDDFMEVFNPRLAVISAANKNFNKKGAERKILPKEEVIKKLLGKDFPITDNMRQRPVFFTYGYDKSLDPTVEKYANWLKLAKKYSEPAAHDIILLVKKEDDGTPLVAGKPPQIRIFSRKRERDSLRAVDTTAKPFVVKPEGVGADKNIYPCNKDALHKPLVLPAFGPAAPSSP
jgi:beta-lactamase superfamily II metal-dependent hydrolase